MILKKKTLQSFEASVFTDQSKRCKFQEDVKPEGKRPLGRPRRRWVDNIRMDLQEVGCGYMDWIGLAQDRDRWRRLVSAVMNLRGSVKCGEFVD